MINQGDIYWLKLDEPKASEPGYSRPVLVVQGNAFNRSAIKTVVVCALTSNMTRAAAPGNVTLQKREGGLKVQSVVNVSQLITVNKVDLAKRIGKLSPQRMTEVTTGIKLVLS